MKRGRIAGIHAKRSALWEVTSPDLALVRLHGRNADTWQREDLSSMRGIDTPTHGGDAGGFIDSVLSG